MRAFVLTVGLLAVLGIPSVSAGQDPIQSNPKVYHLVFENTAVRVLHVTVPPGGKTVPHQHPDNAVVMLTGGKMRFTGADGQSREIEAKANDVLWDTAGTHSGENVGTTAIEGLIVELKGNDAPKAAIPASRPDVSIEPIFDNPRARAIKVTLQPSFHEPAGTTHDFDQVVVTLADSDIALNLDGKTTTHWKRGDAAFIGRGVAHESQNMSKKPIDILIIAIK